MTAGIERGAGHGGGGVDDEGARGGPPIEEATLTPRVRRLVGRDDLVVDGFERHRLTGGVGGGYGGTSVERFAGVVRTADGEPTPWSLVVKVLHERSGERPHDTPYWRREVDAYRSGVLDDLPGGLSAPRVYDVETYPGDCCRLWLEDLGERRDDWPLPTHRLVARRLGAFNGAYLAGRPIPDEPWLVERPFDLRRTASAVAALDRVDDDPIASRIVPSADRPGVFRTWAARDGLLSARGRLPATFCHFDAFERNLFVDQGTGTEGTETGDARTVLLDWDQCGIGRLGDDVGALAFLSLLFGEVAPARARTLEATVLDGYLAGLREAGWDGDVREIRRGYALHVVLRWVEWLGTGYWTAVDERNRTWLEEVDGRGRSLDAIADDWAELGRYVLGLTGDGAIDDVGVDRAGTVR